MAHKTKIMFIDDIEATRNLFLTVASNRKGFTVATAEDGADALHKLKKFPAEVVITDVMMPNMDGMMLLENIKKKYPNTLVLLITGYGTIKNAVEAMKAGAFDYILKPFDFDWLLDRIEKIALNRFDAGAEGRHAKKDGIDYSFENIIGQDQKMLRIYEMITQVAPTNASVLVTGESGTGKELIAEAIHYRSLRRNGPFIKLNIAGLTEGLINSELFGHERGAFTGAMVQKRGILELADSGTVFLDEIGDLPVSVQISLLRFLEQRTFHRVGGTQVVEVDTRIVCATNRDLPRLIKQGLFREDLFYRINVIPIRIPPLRERKSDIPLLAHYFLEKYSRENGKSISRISKPSMDILSEYAWPGNIRQLANIMEQAVIFCKKNMITPECLSEEIMQGLEKTDFSLFISSRSLPQTELMLIMKVLEEKNWNLNQTAQSLQIARNTLYSKMRKYGLTRPPCSPACE
ncbi:MAG: sigma-54-dependent transcriptional regulator [bacterium]